MDRHKTVTAQLSKNGLSSHQLGVGMPSSGSLLCVCGGGGWGDGEMGAGAGRSARSGTNQVAKIRHKYHKHIPRTLSFRAFLHNHIFPKNDGVLFD